VVPTDRRSLPPEPALLAEHLVRATTTIGCSGGNCRTQLRYPLWRRTVLDLPEELLCVLAFERHGLTQAHGLRLESSCIYSHLKPKDSATTDGLERIDGRQRCQSMNLGEGVPFGGPDQRAKVPADWDAAGRSLIAYAVYLA
jgi:hypothetical protein